MEKITSFGLELEGGYDDPDLYTIMRNHYPELDDRMDMGSDGTVHTGARTDGRELRVWFYKSEWRKYEKFIKEIYDLGWVQATNCGNHVHIQTENTRDAILKLAYPHVFNKFLQDYKKFAQYLGSRYMDRLDTEYSYLTDKAFFHNFYEGHRYSAINFTSYNEPQRTIEIRIMPAVYRAEEHIMNTKWVLDEIDKLLRMKHAVRQVRI